MERIKKTKMKIVFFYFKHINHSIKFVFLHNIRESLSGLHHLRVLSRCEEPGVTAWDLADATLDTILRGQSSGSGLVRHGQASPGARRLRRSRRPCDWSTRDRILPA